MRKQIVVEKDRIECFFFENLLGVLNRFGDQEIVAVEAALEPAMTSLVVVQQKNGYGCAFSFQIS
jgi:hypothetical protein